MAFDLTKNLTGINRKAERLAQDLGDARGDLLKSNSVILARSLRKTRQVGKSFLSRRTVSAGTVKRTLKIAPRPYAERSLAAVQDQMVNAAVTIGRKQTV